MCNNNMPADAEERNTPELATNVAEPTLGEVIADIDEELKKENPNAIDIHEEDENWKDILNEWIKQAHDCTEETLPEFIRHLMHDYIHDYGTICHAISTAAVAAAYACNNSKQGGITGFQASFIMWGFIQKWYKMNNKCGLRLIDFDDMLFPQYEEKFNSRTISPKRFENMQKRAQELLDESVGKEPAVSEPVIEHWKSIIAGTVPFGWTVEEDER